MRDSLHRRLVSAKASFDVWEGLQNGRADYRTVAAMDPYAAFFNQAEHASFDSFIVNSCSLFEKRTDTVNFAFFLKMLKSNLGEAEYAAFEREIALLKPTWLKIGRIRNEAIGHRSSQKSVVEIFREVGITPEAIETFLDNSLRILNKISSSTLGAIPNRGFDEHEKMHTKKLLDYLRR